jgi:hypothetical protein
MNHTNTYTCLCGHMASCSHLWSKKIRKKEFCMVTVISALDGLRVCGTKNRKMTRSKTGTCNHMYISVWWHSVHIQPCEARWYEKDGFAWWQWWVLFISVCVCVWNQKSRFVISQNRTLWTSLQSDTCKVCVTRVMKVFVCGLWLICDCMHETSILWNDWYLWVWHVPVQGCPAKLTAKYHNEAYEEKTRCRHPNTHCANSSMCEQVYQTAHKQTCWL